MTDQKTAPVENIIHLHADRTARPRQAIRLVEAYWSALCQDGRVPSRAQVSPQGLRDVLEHVFILERIAPGLARFRIAGSHLRQLTGMEVRGMPFSSFFRTQARSDVSTALEACFSGPCKIEAKVQALSLQSRAPDLSGSLILLPMRCEMGHISRALGALSITGPVLSDAYRLDIVEHSAVPVCCWDVQADDRQRALAEAQARFFPAPRLELVHSRD